MMMMHGSMDTASFGEIESLKASIANYEAKIQSYKDFRERLIRALGFGAPSVSDSDIFTRAETLTRMRPVSPNISLSLSP